MVDSIDELNELTNKFHERVQDHAEYLGQFTDGSKEWHDLRKLGIGSSSIPSVMGMNEAFKSAVTYWAEMTGKVQPEEITPEKEELFKWGHLHEETIAREFVKEFPQFVQFNTGTWRNRTHGYMVVNPDRVLYDWKRDEFCLLEIKTSTYGKGWESGLPPLVYIAQTRYQMATLGIDEGYLSVLIHGNKQKSYRIYRDANKPITNLTDGEILREDTITEQSMIACCEGFLNCVRLDKAPQIDGSVSAWQTVKDLTPTRESGKVYEIEPTRAKALTEAKREKENSEARFNQLRSELMHEMSTSNYLGYRDEENKLVKIATRQQTRGGKYTLAIKSN